MSQHFYRVFKTSANVSLLSLDRALKASYDIVVNSNNIITIHDAIISDTPETECIMEKILLFQTNYLQQIRALAAPMHIQTETIDSRFLKESLDTLYRGGEPKEAPFEGDLPEGSLAVFCNVEDKKLDKLLAAIKKKKIALDYKAIMTPTNRHWTILRLYFELAKEKAAYENARIL